MDDARNGPLDADSGHLGPAEVVRSARALGGPTVQEHLSLHCQLSGFMRYQTSSPVHRKVKNRLVQSRVRGG